MTHVKNICFNVQHYGFVCVRSACVRSCTANNTTDVCSCLCFVIASSDGAVAISSVCPNNNINNINNNNSGAAADAEQNHVTVVEPPKLGPDDTAVHTMARAR